MTVYSDTYYNNKAPLVSHKGGFTLPIFAEKYPILFECILFSECTYRFYCFGGISRTLKEVQSFAVRIQAIGGSSLGVTDVLLLHTAKLDAPLVSLITSRDGSRINIWRGSTRFTHWLPSI